MREVRGYTKGESYCPQSCRLKMKKHRLNRFSAPKAASQSGPQRMQVKNERLVSFLGQNQGRQRSKTEKSARAKSLRYKNYPKGTIHSNAHTRPLATSSLVKQKLKQLGKELDQIPKDECSNKSRKNLSYQACNRRLETNDQVTRNLIARKIEGERIDHTYSRKIATPEFMLERLPQNAEGRFELDLN